MTVSILKQPAAVAPVAMSAVALALVIGQVAIVGTAPQPDEGAAAHLWQVLMAAQIPVIAFFVITSFARAPRGTAVVLAAQVGAAILAALPVFLLRW